jgi:hypothetical protein
MEVELGHPEMEEMRLGREGLARVLNLIFQGLGKGKKRPAGGKK